MKGCFIFISFAMIWGVMSLAKAPNWRERLGMTVDEDLIVKHVEFDSCVDVMEFPLQVNDILVSVNGIKVSTLADFERACKANVSGPLAPWKFGAKRGGNLIFVYSPHFPNMDVLNTLGCGVPRN